MTLEPANADSIAEASRILRAGGIVAFPTETVYGLGADATQSEAIERIFAAKGRPSFNPLIVHIGDVSWAEQLAEADPRLYKLARAFWPGPLSLVMRRRKTAALAPMVSAGLDSVAIRWPANPIARDLLNAVQRPLAAPSANLSGTVSPTRAEHVVQSLGDKVDLILDGGPCTVGLESTVLDLTSDAAAILRPGAITAEQIETVIGQLGTAPVSPDAPKSPGQLLSHYAPGLPVRLNCSEAHEGEALLGFGATENATLNLSARGDLSEAGANLFAMLRELDDPSRFRAIAVAPIPDHGLGAAINDRLRRAAAR